MMTKFKVFDKEKKEFWPETFTLIELASSHRFPSNAGAFYEIIPEEQETLAAENARLQKETDDVLDYYTRTVEELQAENMRLREALQMVQNRLNERGTGVCSFTGDEWTKIDRALAEVGDVPH